MPQFAREVDAARAAADFGLVDKLCDHLIKSCSPAPGHFRVTRLRTEVRVRPLVRQAEEWLQSRLSQMQQDLFTRDPSGSYSFSPESWLNIRESIESEGMTIAPPPTPRRRSAYLGEA
jgi:hypothetical protein